MAKISLSTSDAVDEVRNLVRELISLRKEASGKGLSDLADELKTVENGAKTAFNKLKYLDAILDENSKTVKESETAYAKLKRRYKEVGDEARELAAKHGRYSKKARDAARNTRRLGRELDKINKSTSTSTRRFAGLSKVMSSIVGFTFAYVGIQQLRELATNVFDLTKKLNAFNFAMEAVITNEAELIQTREFLREITDLYGADLISTTHRYIKFRAASREANLSMEDTQKIFRTMTKAAGVLGLQTDELTGIYLALEQMISKGKITTEELRRQLGERLPGAMDIMAKSMGVSTAKLDEMMKKGEVISKDVLPRFAEEVERAFGLAAVSKVNTLVASQQRLANGWTNLINAIESGQGRISKPLMDFFDDLTEVLKLVEQFNRTDQDWMNVSRAQGYNEEIKNINKTFEEYKRLFPDEEFTIKEIAGKQLLEHQEKFVKLQEKVNNAEGLHNLFKKESNELTKNDLIILRAIKAELGDASLTYDEIRKIKQQEMLNDKKDLGYIKGKIDAARSFYKIIKETETVEEGKVDTSAIDLLIEKKRQQVEVQKEIRDNEILAINIRKEAIQKAYDFEIELLELKAEKQIMLAEGVANKEELIYLKLNFDKEQLEAKSSQQKLDIYEKYIKDRADAAASEISTEANIKIQEIKSKYADITNLSKEQEKAMNEEIAEIKRIYGNKALEEQAKILQLGLDYLELDGEARIALEQKIQELLANIKLKGKEQSLDDDKKYLKEILDLANEFAQSIGDIFDAQAERRIEAINAEIEAEKYKYDEKIRLAGDDIKEKESLEKQRDDKLRILEKKRLKEEQKQAKIRKAFAVADIQMKLAQTIIAIQLAAAEQDAVSLGVLGKIYRAIQIPLAIATAAAQTAAVLSAPIPQYAEGSGGPIKYAHKGMINDAKDQEFVKRGSSILTTKTKNAIIDLKPKDIVYKNKDEMMKDLFLTSAIFGGSQITPRELSALSNIDKIIEKGFEDAKINNNIKLNILNGKDEQYRASLSRWN